MQTTPKKPGLLSPSRFPLWLAIAVVLSVLSTILVWPHDSGWRFLSLGGAVLTGAGLYRYTHPKKTGNAG